MDKTLKITGFGKLFVRPDTTIIKIDLINKDTSYENILKKTNENFKIIKENLLNLNIKENQIKTSYFKVDIDNESYRDNEGNYKTRFIGYKSYQTIKVTFKNNKKLLGDILYILSKTSLNPTFSIEYIIKNQDRIKNKLLTNAIFDANKKANEIAKNLNIEINEIVNVDYSFSDQNFSLSLMENQCLKAVSTKENYNFDLNPDDIEVEEKITIIFSIK